MNTQKPFSSISYNTVDWLRVQLDKLITQQDIVFYAFITHYGEDDEAGLKDHIHVYVEPNGRFKTTVLTDMCIEPTPANPLPLKMMPCRHSEFDDWYMYVIHDENYLRYKGLSPRKYVYLMQQFVVSDMDYFRCKVRTIDLMHVSWYSRMQECIENNISFHEFFSQGRIPVQQVRNYELAWNHLLAWHTMKMGKRKAQALSKKSLDNQSNV